jgi:Ca2+-binding EF-hand superfamily protein
MPAPPQQAIADFFQKFDQDKNGLIDFNEFRNFVLAFNGLS